MEAVETDQKSRIVLKYLKEQNPDLNEFNFDIEVNKLSLFTGPNGTGKTFLLGHQYFLTLLIHVLQEMREVFDDKTIQKVFDHCFDNFKYTGTCEYHIKGDFVVVSLKEGVIQNISVNITNTFKHSKPIYLSSKTRLMSSIEDILRQLSFVEQAAVAQGHEQYSNKYNEFIDENFSKYYKIYDLEFTMSMKAAFIGSWKDISFLQESLEKFFAKDETDITKVKQIFKEITYDSTKNKFIGRNYSGQEIELSSLSAGEQSLYTMLLGNTLNRV